MTRHVWLCTRPLKAAIGVSPLESTSKPDKPHFRHWGILVTEWTEPEFRDIIQTPQERGPIPHRTLGTMYQLRRDGKQMECLVDEDFTIEKVRDTWGKTFTAHPVGTTEMADEEIRDRPDYYVIQNNCQNFARYLLEKLCPTAPVPDTIQAVLDQMTKRYTCSIRLPGSYPE
jgi:hypothetical protein